MGSRRPGAADLRAASSRPRLLERARPWWETWPERFRAQVERLVGMQVAYGYAMAEPRRGDSGHPVPVLIARLEEELESALRVLYLSVRDDRLRLRFRLDAWPVLGNPANRNRAVPLTHEQFRYGIANAVGADEATQLYETFAVPASGAPLFQAATANLNPCTEVKVDTETPARGSLLIISGEKDHTVPWAIANASFKQQQRGECAAVCERAVEEAYSRQLRRPPDAQSARAPATVTAPVPLRPSAGFVASETRYAADAHLAEHHHASATLSLVFGGEYEERVGRRAYTCAALFFVYKPPRVEHSNRIGARGLHALLVEIAPARLADAADVVGAMRDPILLGSAAVRGLVGRTGAELRARLPGFELAVEGLLLELLASLARLGAAAPERRAPR